MSFSMIENQQLQQNRYAVFAYLFFDDLFEESVGYFSNLPSYVDIYIATNTEEKSDTIKRYISEMIPKHHVEMLLHTNKGRDVAALLVLFKRYYSNYDVICFVHDKKSSQMKYESVGRDFNNRIWQSLLGSKELVEGVLSTFSNEKYLGLLMPSMVTHGEYFHTSIDSWTICYDGTVELAKKIGLNVPIYGDRNPLSLGTAFWARTKALEKLFEYNFSYDMFPGEPFPVDGSISHYIERIFPYVALDAGYYTGIVYTKEIAANELININYSLNQILKRVDKYEGINTVNLAETLVSLDRAPFRKKTKDPIFIDSRLSNERELFLSEFKNRYDLAGTYKWIRNQLIISSIYPKQKFLKGFSYKLKKKVRNELSLYRYFIIEIICDAIEDYLKGAEYLEKYYRSYDNIEARQILDVDYKWFYQCAQIDDCDFIHMIVRYITLNGYLLRANRSIIVPVDNCKAVQGYRATDITFFDDVTCCGYTCSRDFGKAIKCVKRFKRLIKQLRREYKKIAEDYRKAYPELSTEEQWNRRLDKV